VLSKIDKNTKISELGSIKVMFAWLVKKCSLIPPLPCSLESIFLYVMNTTGSGTPCGVLTLGPAYFLGVNPGEIIPQDI